MKTESKNMAYIILGTFTVLIAGVFLLSKNSPQISETGAYDTKILEGKNTHKIFSKSAKVTIVEFGDYECPACAVIHPTIQRILEKNKGKINYVFRHFPLPQHKNALVSAEAAESAGAQGKFFQMHDLLFAKQNEWVPSENPLPFFVKYAKQLKLKTEKFENDIKNNKYEEKINSGLSDGAKVDINATPTFFVNGIKFEDSPTFENFQAKIDGILKN